MKSNPTTFRATCVSSVAIKRNTVNHEHSLRQLFLTLLLLSALLLLFAVNASAQQSGELKAITENKVVSNGYYSYVVTGNADVDADNAAKAKKEFFDKHPDQYEKMIREESTSQKHVIDAKEFEAMPAQKRANILAHPELYIIKPIDQPK